MSGIGGTSPPHFPLTRVRPCRRARKYDVAQSEKMLRDYLQWREAYGANSLLTDVARAGVTLA